MTLSGRTAEVGGGGLDSRRGNVPSYELNSLASMRVTVTPLHDPHGHSYDTFPLGFLFRMSRPTSRTRLVSYIPARPPHSSHGPRKHYLFVYTPYVAAFVSWRNQHQSRALVALWLPSLSYLRPHSSPDLAVSRTPAADSCRVPHANRRSRTHRRALERKCRIPGEIE